MKISMHPLSLAKANSELWLSALGANQDYRRCWLEAAARYHDGVIAATRDALTQATSETPSQNSVGDWINLPMQLALISQNALMAMNVPLLEGQTAFARGMQQAFDDWMAKVTTASDRES